MSLFGMAKTVTRSLFKKPATLMYPYTPAKATAISRGHVTIDVATCISCRICQKKCPAGAICVEPKEKTWEIDRMRCVVCNCCVEVCPVKCLNMNTHYTGAFRGQTSRDLYHITYVKPPRPEKSEA